MAQGIAGRVLGCIGVVITNVGASGQARNCGESNRGLNSLHLGFVEMFANRKMLKMSDVRPTKVGESMTGKVRAEREI